MNKLILIQSALKAPKSQYNSFGKYKYRNCEDILEAVKPLLKEHGLVLTISDEVLEAGSLVFVNATATLTDEENKITKSVSAQAGIDPNRKGMDIAQSFGSSSSYARKYALNGLFLIDDTKDADATNNHSSSPTTPAKAKAPEMTKEDAVGSLAGAKDIKALGEAWSQIPVNLKQNADVLGIKEARKAELQPTK